MAKTTIAEPLLSSDSPSMMSESRSGAPMARSVDTTATGSVAHTIAPNVSATFQSHRPPCSAGP